MCPSHQQSCALVWVPPSGCRWHLWTHHWPCSSFLQWQVEWWSELDWVVMLLPYNHTSLWSGSCWATTLVVTLQMKLLSSSVGIDELSHWPTPGYTTTYTTLNGCTCPYIECTHLMCRHECTHVCVCAARWMCVHVTTLVWTVIYTPYFVRVMINIQRIMKFNYGACIQWLWLLHNGYAMTEYEIYKQRRFFVDELMFGIQLADILTGCSSDPQGISEVWCENDGAL